MEWVYNQNIGDRKKLTPMVPSHFVHLIRYRSRNSTTTCLMDNEFPNIIYGMKWLMYGILFLHAFSSLCCFCPLTFFSNNVLDNLPWSSFITDSNIKLSIINKRIPELALSLLAVFWSVHEPFAFTFRLMFFIWLLVCTLGIVERNFYWFLAFINVFVT